MANDPTAAIGAAVFARLSSPAITYSEGGQTYTAQVFQRVPDETFSAVVVIDGIDLQASDTKDATPRRVSINIVTVYRGRSKASAQAIIGMIFNRLEGHKLTVSGFNVSDCRLQFSGVGEETTEANLVHVGRQTFELIVL
jgi:hypothetical protein